MQFEVLDYGQRPEEADIETDVVLVPDSWDDFHYRTTFDLWLFPPSGRRLGRSPKYIGKVKIACVGQQPGPSPLPQGEFRRLNAAGGPRWFSLGDLNYYDELRTYASNFARERIFSALGDIAYQERSFDIAMGQPVTESSLLRGVEVQTVLFQYRRVANGGAPLTNYSFRYTSPAQVNGETGAAQTMTFEVDPASNPASNIHILIGRNGAGKTTLLRNIADAVIRPGIAPLIDGVIEHFDVAGTTAGAQFVNEVSVTFSAFDPFPVADGHGIPQLPYEYVGLAAQDDPDRRKSPDELAEEFELSALEIEATGRWQDWVTALEQLSTDPHFARSRIHDYARHPPHSLLTSKEHRTPGYAREIFSELSSGHAIVLLTITKLVELVAEQSLVLFDEPEAHLHPPLLSAFIRTLSNLLTHRNGVAIVATHSPVVLQEVPRSCVWKINRPGGLPRRPRIETFGENVGVLTHEIFGLEVRESGFYAEIEKAVQGMDSYEEVLTHFGGQLGGEAKGLVRIFLADKAARDRH
ncbi:AAA family ATPase [Streptomyces sp. NPDC051662]|uniref:ATP-dependent nuclease n=1 Tax=Streptomyces sp. NPDC051662 TaxID=3154750 RepID=UPI00341311E2